MHQGKRPQVLMLFRGPKWDLDDFFGERLALLSRDFAGNVLTSGARTEMREYDRFEVQCLDHERRPTLHMIGSLLRFIVRKRWRREKVDLIVCSDPLKMGLLGVIAARLLGARLVVELNGDHSEDVLYTDAVSGKVNRRRKRLYLRLIHFVLARCDGIKTLYPNQVEPFRSVIDRQRVAAFHNYVKLSQFKPMPEEKEVLLAGFPFLVKGVDLLIEAFKRIAPRHPQWRLVILGWYPDPTLLQRHIAGHPRIEVRRPVHHRDMPEQIGHAGICVLASRSEGMGRFLLEAMYAGKARIGARVGGIPTLIEDGVDGLLFEPEDIDGLARTLDRLMEDDALRQRLGQAAKRRSRLFGAESYYRHLRSFYMEILGGGSAQGIGQAEGGVEGKVTDLRSVRGK